MFRKISCATKSKKSCLVVCDLNYIEFKRIEDLNLRAQINMIPIEIAREKDNELKLLFTDLQSAIKHISKINQKLVL